MCLISKPNARTTKIYNIYLNIYFYYYYYYYLLFLNLFLKIYNGYLKIYFLSLFIKTLMYEEIVKDFDMVI